MQRSRLTFAVGAMCLITIYAATSSVHTNFVFRAHHFRAAVDSYVKSYESSFDSYKRNVKIR